MTARTRPDVTHPLPVALLLTLWVLWAVVVFTDFPQVVDWWLIAAQAVLTALGAVWLHSRGRRR